MRPHRTSLLHKRLTPREVIAWCVVILWPFWVMSCAWTNLALRRQLAESGRDVCELLFWIGFALPMFAPGAGLGTAYVLGRRGGNARKWVGAGVGLAVGVACAVAGPSAIALSFL